jgi:hypothetical protein
MDEMLPMGWKKHTDPSSGNDYYANQATGETSWTKPDAPLGSALQQVRTGRNLV